MFQNHSESLQLTDEEQQLLQKQTISNEMPGSILKDFETLLGVVGEKGIETAGKYSFFSMGKLAEINSQLTHSVQLNLKRPQQKSFPHVNGLYLLLRSTGIVFPKNIGKKRLLVLDEALLQSWHGLNFTEKYFTLLEAWLLQGYEEILREHSLGFPYHLPKCQTFCARHFNKANTFKPLQKKDEFSYFPEWYNLALMQMFGFITIKSVPKKVESFWLIEQIQLTHFGNIMIRLLHFITLKKIEWDIFDVQEFGQWQTDLQPFFPTWKNNLIAVETEFQDGVYVFKVALGKVWRRIAIAGTDDLESLSDTILKAFDFDHDHLYQFKYRNRKGLIVEVNAPMVEDEPPFTTEVLVGSLALNPGDSMDYIFDFGDYWQFALTLEKVEKDNQVISKPTILESHGEAPEQYGDDEYFDSEW